MYDCLKKRKENFAFTNGRCTFFFNEWKKIMDVTLS